MRLVYDKTAKSAPNAPVYDLTAIDIWIVETCRRLSLPIRDYLGPVLTGLAAFPSNRVAELTPCALANRS